MGKYNITPPDDSFKVKYFFPLLLVALAAIAVAIIAPSILGSKECMAPSSSGISIYFSVLFSIDIKVLWFSENKQAAFNFFLQELHRLNPALGNRLIQQVMDNGKQ